MPNEANEMRRKLFETLEFRNHSGTPTVQAEALFAFRDISSPHQNGPTAR